MPGRRPLDGGSHDGVVAQVLAGGRGHVGGMVTGEQRVVAAVRRSFWRRSVPCVGGREFMLRETPARCFPGQRRRRPMDIIPFLKASLRTLSALLHAPGENP